MKRLPIAAAAALFVATAAPAVHAVTLFDNGLRTSVVSLRSSVDEDFTCGPTDCEQDHETLHMMASRITLANGGAADAFTFAGMDYFQAATIAIYRASGSGRLIADSAHLAWQGSGGSRTTLVPDPFGGLPLLEQIAFTGLSVPLLAGEYWVELSGFGPTFGRQDILAAGLGDGPIASRSYDTNRSPSRWSYSTGPEVAVRIDASSISPAAIPEPATWTLLLAGFGGLGAALRRRRRASALIYKR